MNKPQTKKYDVATLAAGCFWCTETIFKRLKGIVSVKPGYTGGITENPTYEEVLTGTTGHAEAIQIKFKPSIISYEQILDVFWNVHDPTTLNRQGNDIGTNYRSAIFYHTNMQRDIAFKSLNNLKKKRIYKNRIVTQIIPFSYFYDAENYHRNYFENNSKNTYCSLVISPKLDKFSKKYSALIKKDYR